MSVVLDRAVDREGDVSVCNYLMDYVKRDREGVSEPHFDHATVTGGTPKPKENDPTTWPKFDEHREWEADLKSNWGTLVAMRLAVSMMTREHQAVMKFYIDEDKIAVSPCVEIKMFNPNSMCA